MWKFENEFQNNRFSNKYQQENLNCMANNSNQAILPFSNFQINEFPN
jgi:hypothetical protein